MVAPLNVAPQPALIWKAMDAWSVKAGRCFSSVIGNGATRSVKRAAWTRTSSVFAVCLNAPSRLLEASL